MGTRGASLVDLEIKKDNREKAILRAPTMDMLLKGLHAIELYTHLTLRKVRNDESASIVTWILWSIQLKVLLKTISETRTAVGSLWLLSRLLWMKCSIWHLTEHPGNPPNWSLSKWGATHGQIHWMRNHSSLLLRNGVKPRFLTSSSDLGWGTLFMGQWNDLI